MSVEHSNGDGSVPDDPAPTGPQTPVTVRAEVAGEGAVNDTEARYGDNESPA